MVTSVTPLVDYGATVVSYSTLCFGGIIFFLLSIPLLPGRWKPADARRDEQEHEAMVQAELAKLGS